MSARVSDPSATKGTKMAGIEINSGSTHLYITMDLTEQTEKKYDFDSRSDYWTGRADLNEFFLRQQQNVFNDYLRYRGHVYLNEIFDKIGLPRTIEGQILGWSRDLNSVSFIDFDPQQFGPRAFTLKFNLDGPILGWM